MVQRAMPLLTAVETRHCVIYVVLSLLPPSLPTCLLRVYVLSKSLLPACTYLLPALQQATISNMQLIKNDNPSLSASEGPSSEKPSYVMSCPSATDGSQANLRLPGEGGLQL